MISIGESVNLNLFGWCRYDSFNLDNRVSISPFCAVVDFGFCVVLCIVVRWKPFSKFIYYFEAFIAEWENVANKTNIVNMPLAFCHLIVFSFHIRQTHCSLQGKVYIVASDFIYRLSLRLWHIYFFYYRHRQCCYTPDNIIISVSLLINVLNWTFCQHSKWNKHSFRFALLFGPVQQFGPIHLAQFRTLNRKRKFNDAERI